MQRRQFLSTLAAASAVLAVRPSQARPADRVLLVVELAGGNDSLNTFIPYTDPNYQTLRPDLAIRDGIPVSSKVAFHPALTEWRSLLDAGSLAVVQNVGYPNPDLSHFRSQEIWHSGLMQPTPATGWLARYLDASGAKPADAIFLGGEYPLALMGHSQRYLHLSPELVVSGGGALGDAVRDLYSHPQSNPLAERVRQTVAEGSHALQELRSDIERSPARGYPRSPMGRTLALLERSLQSGAKVVYVTVGGWDTHTNQLNRHARLLEQLGQGLATLYRNLEREGRDREVLALVHSEFGRRPAQNGSRGTDHGTAGSAMLLGSVRGGLYGGAPALDSLTDGNLVVQIDFRRIYSEILNHWLGATPTSVLQQSFERL
ncbi:MAG: DUF1501 domain-containing protein, partial [Cyanobacteria bacterium J06648_11]